MIQRLILATFLFFCTWVPGQAQTESDQYTFGISAALGIDVFSSPAITDYVNSITQPVDRLDEFGSAVEFALTPELRISEEWTAGLDYNYLIKSYSVVGAGGGSRFTLGVHLPFLVLHYLIPLQQSRLKVGGGVGMALASFEEALYGSTRVRGYRARGGGFKLEAVGSSKLDEHFYSVLALDLRWIFGGTFHDGVSEARIGNAAAEVDYFSAGLKFGVEFAW